MVSKARPSSTAVSFDVADVTPATKAMEEQEYRRVLASRINNCFPVDPERDAAMEASIEFCSGDARRVMGFVGNGFLTTLCFAFIDHRPVVLSPDMAWLLL